MSEDYILVLKRADMVQNIPGVEIPIPEGFIISEDPSYVAERQKQEEILRIEEFLAQNDPPPETELTELGILIHPYFEAKRKLDSLKGGY